MIKTVLPALAGIAFAMSSALSPANAVSPGIAPSAEPETLVQKAFGCHRSCERGPVPRWDGIVRWHRHVGRGCAPVACYPRAAYPNRCWVDGFGVRHCRW
jgi:hypothetical protein